MGITQDPIGKEAIKYIRAHTKKLIDHLIESARPSSHQPLSIFMAGSPGAGKTEFSKRIIPILEQGGIDKIVRIDPDDLRGMLPGYTGANSHLFQGATSIGVEKIHDYVLKNNINFLLDGTLSNSTKAQNNIERSIKRKRVVLVFYIFLDPKIAWELTQKREALEGRKISKEVFVDHLFNSYQTVDLLRKRFKNNNIVLYLVDKKSINVADFTITQIKANLASYKGINENKSDLLKNL